MEPETTDTWHRWLVPAGLTLTVAWGLYAQAFAPLRQRGVEARRSVVALKERIADARKSAGEIQEMEVRASREGSELDALQADLPAGSAIIWLPELVKGHFPRFGIPGAVVRLNTTREEPQIPGYERGYWSVGLPIDEGRNVTGLLLAVADLEQQHPFVHVLDFAIRPDPERPGQRMAGLNVAVLHRK